MVPVTKLLELGFLLFILVPFSSAVMWLSFLILVYLSSIVLFFCDFRSSCLILVSFIVYYYCSMIRSRLLARRGLGGWSSLMKETSERHFSVILFIIGWSWVEGNCLSFSSRLPLYITSALTNGVYLTIEPKPFLFNWFEFLPFAVTVVVFFRSWLSSESLPFFPK